MVQRELLHDVDFQEKDVIRVLRLMGHDFLNQLQVIAGYLQLGRTQQAFSYLQDTVSLLTTRQNLFRWVYPACALQVLFWQLRFFEGAKKLLVQTGTDLQGIGVPEELLADLLDDLLESMYAVSMGAGGEDWLLKVEEQGENYLFGLEYLGAAVPDYDWSSLQSRAEGLGCRLEQDREKGKVLLTCPKGISPSPAE